MSVVKSGRRFLQSPHCNLCCGISQGGPPPTSPRKTGTSRSLPHCASSSSWLARARNTFERRPLAFPRRLHADLVPLPIFRSKNPDIICVIYVYVFSSRYIYYPTIIARRKLGCRSIIEIWTPLDNGKIIASRKFGCSKGCCWCPAAREGNDWTKFDT